MWYCKSCGEYFDDPQSAQIEEGMEIKFCPYCGSIEVKAIDTDNDWRKYIND